jgi:hypothetical protein
MKWLPTAAASAARKTRCALPPTSPLRPATAPTPGATSCASPVKQPKEAFIIYTTIRGLAARRARGGDGANQPQAQSGISVRKPRCGVAFNIGVVLPALQAEGDTPMYGSFEPNRSILRKVRGAAFFAKIRASTTGESDLQCIYGAKWPATGARNRRVRTIAATPWNPLEGFKLTSRHLLPS